MNCGPVPWRDFLQTECFYEVSQRQVPPIIDNKKGVAVLRYKLAGCHTSHPHHWMFLKLHSGLHRRLTARRLWVWVSWRLYSLHLKWLLPGYSGFLRHPTDVHLLVGEYATQNSSPELKQRSKQIKQLRKISHNWLHFNHAVIFLASEK